jgi:hypothetical protein
MKYTDYLIFCNTDTGSQALLTALLVHVSNSIEFSFELTVHDVKMGPRFLIWQEASILGNKNFGK